VKEIIILILNIFNIQNMNCRRCESKIFSDDKFCRGCGGRVDYAVKPRSSLTKILLVIFGVIFITFIVVGNFVIDSSDPVNTWPQSDMEALYQKLNSPVIQDSDTKEADSISKETNLVSVIKEWSRSTSYVLCEWYFPTGGVRYYQSGSGLVAMINSVPTIITNSHVAYSQTYGEADGCAVKFPGDSGHYSYFRNTFLPLTGGLGTISYIPNLDIAFIKDIKDNWVNNMLGQDGRLVKPTISLENRAKSGAYACKNKLNIGERIIVVGYPSYGAKIESIYNSAVEPTITEGIISGKDGIYYTTSAKIEHGNSGGLAIDVENNCYAGIPTWNTSGEFESLGRILPSSEFLFY
jgi:hypothetical protein